MSWQTVGMIAGFVLPLFNIPLIHRMVRWKSSDDLSLTRLLAV